MAAVMIGVDPHKASHTAVAISGSEEQLGTLRVRAGAAQAARMLEWAAAWPERTWAVEGAGGLGHLLAQQLLAAGETVATSSPSSVKRARTAGSASASIIALLSVATTSFGVPLGAKNPNHPDI